MSEDKRTDEEVLSISDTGLTINTDKHGPIKILPWTWGEYKKVASDIDKLFSAALEERVDISLLREREAMDKYLARVYQPAREMLGKIQEGEEVDLTPDGMHPTEAEVDEMIADINDEQTRLVRMFAHISDYVEPLILKSRTEPKLSKKMLDACMPHEVLGLFILIYSMNWSALANPYETFNAIWRESELSDEAPTDEDSQEKEA